jgi:hypothetical protein
MRERWTAEAAAAWHGAQPWLMGCNFTPSTAINQLEMWQAATFDLPTIERELTLAASAGMNVARVYLHDLLWVDDAPGLLARVEQLLAAADARGIGVMLVLFDSCWRPDPALGPQPHPVDGVHNSGWLQAPGPAALADPAQHPRLRAYVEGMVAHFAHDRRVIAWDVWNEPDNGAEVSACDPAELNAKAALVLPVLRAAFAWARGAAPSQPLTSGIWLGDWSAPDKLTELQRAQLDESDIVSFHNYGDADDFARRIAWLSAWGRPILCSEFMARPAGSTFQSILPIARAEGVGAICWGLVRGKTQTHLPWVAWQEKGFGGVGEPWFHDIFEVDGAAHDPAEVEFLRLIARIDARAPHWPIVAVGGVGAPDAADQGRAAA